ncbi:MAG TPA: sigma 54-interacting transcriptional regulator [Oscillospiraceae bacterium]|nr:sigma 54-interacting transcriptional regulator [Oscillospiraceae bacterium]
MRQDLPAEEMRLILWTIINSVQDAISVVDEHGKGILFNHAYLQATGLQEADVLNKPAEVDIVEGESVHLKVLETGKPIRGVPMKVGRYKRHVMVSCAPLYIDNKLRGSVGIIHDVSEVRALSAELQRAKQKVRQLETKYTFDDIIGESTVLKQAIQLAKVAAATPATVLLRGAGGTGKELFAHAIHHASPRQGEQFIRVNCSAFPESLLESELFGYSDGAFTGARRQGKKGIFEEADGGTIFLDEIGTMPLSLQAKILRVLQEGEIVRIGEARPLTVDVRVIAATNADLEKLIMENKFREDLYYRLNVFPIYIPPLVERKADIPLLAQYYLHALGEDYNRPDTELSSTAAKMLQEYHWPGNVRELKNVMARALINLNKDEKLVKTRHLMFSLSTSQQISSGRDVQVYDGETLAQQHARWEKNILLETLHSTKGNKTEAARQLGISVRSLYNKLEKYGV